MNMYTFTIICILFTIAIVNINAALPALNVVRSFESCEFDCSGGACSYENCVDVACPGGACYFLNCVNPSCGGGACEFVGCRGATCSGGSCSFSQVTETLQAGYCHGGNCDVDGVAHPSLSDYLSV